jgi:predicted esterase
MLLLLIAMVAAPSGGAADARVHNCFLGGSGQFARYSPWNIIPEVDQLRVGLSLVPLALPEVDSAEAGRIRSLVLPLYDAMNQDDDFRELGSVMGTAYRDLCHIEFRTGHYYVVLPDTSKGERVPCLVFLHGMGGNIKACLWVLAELSRRGKCAVIAPTFGMGDWDRPGGAELVVDVVREAITALPLDRKRVFLMGYSNGGMGVTRAAVEDSSLFQGLIYLSPVTEDELFSTPEFLSRARDRRILFLQGGRDKRIPRSVVEGTVTSLRRLGCDVRLKVYDDEDHYLLFSQQESVLGEIGEFMTATDSAE